MPWTPAEAPQHTKQADTDRLRELWASVANAARGRGDSDAMAIRKANAAVDRAKGGRSWGSSAAPGHKWT